MPDFVYLTLTWYSQDTQVLAGVDLFCVLCYSLISLIQWTLSQDIELQN